MGVREKEKQETGLFNCFSHTTTPYPFPPLPSGWLFRTLGSFPLSPHPLNYSLKNFSICHRNLREFLWSWNNQFGLQPKPLPQGLLSVTAFPLLPPEYINLGEGGRKIRVSFGKIEAIIPLEPYPHRGSLLKWLVQGLFCQGNPFSPSPSCHIHNMEGGLLEGLGVLTTCNYGWDRLCQ